MIKYSDCKKSINSIGREKFEELIEIYGEEAIEGYLSRCLIDGFEEAYSGQFSSDEEFAEEMAENLGLIPKDYTWPHSCIDWEWAASDLMFDYFEVNGYYFRKM